MSKQKRNISSIDIGTNAVKILTAEYQPETGAIDIKSFIEQKIDGVVKGDVVDIIKVSKGVNDALLKIKSSSMYPETLYVGVSGNHIYSKEQRGVIVLDRSQKFDASHLGRVADSITRQVQFNNASMLNHIESHYTIDDITETQSPIGQVGQKLELKSHVIYGNKNRIETVQNVIKEVGFDSCNIVFNGLASALSVLREDDYEYGTLVINIGAGTTEYALFHDYNLVLSGAIAVGINHIINDLFLGLEVDLPFVRELVIGGKLAEYKMNGDYYIEKKGTITKRQIPISTIDEIINLRIQEIFDLVKNKLAESSSERLMHNGVILTGGIVNLDSALDIAKTTFASQIRVGQALETIDGPSEVVEEQSFLTALGLLVYGTKEVATDTKGNYRFIRKVDHAIWGSLRKLWGKIANV